MWRTVGFFKKRSIRDSKVIEVGFGGFLKTDKKNSVLEIQNGVTVKNLGYYSIPTIFLRVTVGILLGRTKGLPAARAIKSWAQMPIVRETPNITV